MYADGDGSLGRPCFVLYSNVWESGTLSLGMDYSASLCSGPQEAFKVDSRSGGRGRKMPARCSAGLDLTVRQSMA